MSPTTLLGPSGMYRDTDQRGEPARVSTGCTQGGGTRVVPGRVVWDPRTTARPDLNVDILRGQARLQALGRQS